MISVALKDGKGTNKELEITKEGEALVSVSPYPPLKSQKTVPFRQYLTEDGTASGANDMGVDGSVTNREFYISADEKKDRYITTLSVLVGYGTSAAPFQFADSTALSSGCKLFYTSGPGEVIIHEAIKTNQDMFRLSTNRFDNNWELRGVNALNDYGYIVYIDLTRFSPAYGIKLDAGTKERLQLTIRDNATNADSFNILAHGFDRFM